MFTWGTLCLKDSLHGTIRCWMNLADNSFTPLCSAQTSVLNVFQTVGRCYTISIFQLLLVHTWILSHTCAAVQPPTHKLHRKQIVDQARNAGVWSLWKLNPRWHLPPVVMTMELASQHCVWGKNKCIPFFT